MREHLVPLKADTTHGKVMSEDLGKKKSQGYVKMSEVKVKVFKKNVRRREKEIGMRVQHSCLNH